MVSWMLDVPPAPRAAGGSVPGLLGTLVWCSPRGPALGWVSLRLRPSCPCWQRGASPLHRVLATRSEGWWHALRLRVCASSFLQVTNPQKSDPPESLGLSSALVSLALCRFSPVLPPRAAGAAGGPGLDPAAACVCASPLWRSEPTALALGLVLGEREEPEAVVCPRQG